MSTTLGNVATGHSQASRLLIKSVKHREGCETSYMLSYKFT